MTATNQPLVTWADLKERFRPLKAFDGEDEIALGAAADAALELLAEKGVSIYGGPAEAKTTPEAILADLTRMRDSQPSDNNAQMIRRAAYNDVVSRVRDLVAGCTCRPGLMVSHWGCPVEGHDASWEE